MTSTPQFSTSPHPYTKMPVPPKLAKFSTAQTSSVLKISPLQPSSISTSTAPLPQHLKLSLSENENLIPQPPVRKLVCYRAYPNKEKPCGNFAKEMFSRFFGTIKEILRTILFNVLFGGLSLIVIFIYQIMKTLVITTTDVFWGVTLQILALFPGKSLPARFWSLKRAKAGYEGNYDKASKCRPYFPNAKDNKPLTLVLDLDETLIHSTRSLPIHGTFDSLEIIKTDGLPQKVYLRKRPYLSEFLEKVGSEFNIVIFTASRQEYADVILDFVDPKNIISRRLYRESCIKTETGFFKDLTKVGQDLSKIILLDNSLVAGSLQPENYLPIKSWFHDEADKFLLHYTNFFLECAKKWKSDSSTTKDIRKYLKTYLYQGKHQIKEDTVPVH